MIKIASTKTGILALGIVLATSASAFAHGNQARFNEQGYMIETGRQNGAITWREGIKLRKEQRTIARVREVLKSDGYLSRRDRRLLMKLQNNAESHIVSEASDRWHRAWWLPRVGK